jgi:hypothetical protein
MIKIKFIVILFITACRLNSYCATYTAVVCPGTFSGFNSTSPFFSGVVRLNFQPNSGDVLVVPAGCTVTITDEIIISNAVTFNIYGVLIFDSPSHKLRFNNIASVVSIFAGGAITAPSNSNQIKIGNGGAEWSGPGTLNGPATISNGFLPVELIDFSANCLSNGVEVNWSTASEVNNDYFLIERSLNGIDYDELTKVTANNNSSSIKNYSYNCSENANELTYYRLSQVDKNGLTTIFKAIDIQCKNHLSDQFIIYPNPAKSEINLRINADSKSDNTSIVIQNIFGGIILEFKTNMVLGLNSYSIPLNISAGTYYINLVSDNSSPISQKLIITN